jgi:hypothetical protein
VGDGQMLIESIDAFEGDEEHEARIILGTMIGGK